MKIKAKKNGKPFDIMIFTIVVILLVLGNIMVLSASGPSALSETGNSYYFFVRQFAYTIMGFLLMLWVSKWDYKIFKKLVKPIYAVCVVLLALVLIIGDNVNGAVRWINLGFVTLQPSEFVKIGMLIFFAWLVSSDGSDNLNKFSKLAFHYGLPLMVIVGLLFLEPHKSAVIIISLSCFFVMIAGGLKKEWVIGAVVVGTIGILGISLKDGYSNSRIMNFLDPWQDPSGDGYQVIQSLYAIGSGGLFGKGLGNSIQKHGYIPEPQNDFIFSIIAEELGFVTVVIVISLFILLIWRGIQVAMGSKDNFGSLLATGIVSLFAIQVIFNIAVVSASMPVTGIPLPFFSYGGSAMIANLIEVGILLSISRNSSK